MLESCGQIGCAGDNDDYPHFAHSLNQAEYRTGYHDNILSRDC